MEADQAAKSVNHLSYDLVSRAISHRGAGAGLINPYSLDERIKKRNIPLLVGNPTDTSDIAFIDTHGKVSSQWVELVLGRNYNMRYDDGIYGRKNPESQENHIIYLMGENIGNLKAVYTQALKILTEIGLESIAGEMKFIPKWELSFVFKNSEDALKAQQAFHRYFIESI